MFSSPAFRVYNRENADSQMARKGGLANSVTRKAFQDRDVNSKGVEKTPLKLKINQQLDIKPLVLKTVETPKPQQKYPDWLFDGSSYKDVTDNYEDILPRTERLTVCDLKKTLKAFTHLTDLPTPPPPSIPSPTKDIAYTEMDLLFDLPTSNQKLVFNYLEEEEEAECVVPPIDMDALEFVM